MGRMMSCPIFYHFCFGIYVRRTDDNGDDEKCMMEASGIFSSG